MNLVEKEGNHSQSRLGHHKWDVVVHHLRVRYSAAKAEALSALTSFTYSESHRPHSLSRTREITRCEQTCGCRYRQIRKSYLNLASLCWVCVHLSPPSLAEVKIVMRRSVKESRIVGTRNGARKDLQRAGDFHHSYPSLCGCPFALRLFLPFIAIVCWNCPATCPRKLIASGNIMLQMKDSWSFMLLNLSFLYLLIQHL